MRIVTCVVYFINILLGKSTRKEAKISSTQGMYFYIPCVNLLPKPQYAKLLYTPQFAIRPLKHNLIIKCVLKLIKLLLLLN